MLAMHLMIFKSDYKVAHKFSKVRIKSLELWWSRDEYWALVLSGRWGNIIQERIIDKLLKFCYQYCSSN